MQLGLTTACDLLRHTKAGKNPRCKQCTPYNARSLRCYHATRYIWHVTEAALVGADPDPNPL